MFGDLFKKKQFDEKGPAPQNPQGQFMPSGQVQYISQDQAMGNNVMQPAYPQQMTPQMQPGVSPQGIAGSSMDPSKRQNVNALSHLDSRSNQILQQAQNEAKKYQKTAIEPDLLLLSLTYDREIYKLLQKHQVDVASLAQEIEQKQEMGTSTTPPILSESTQRIFDEAYKFAQKRSSSFISPEDLLLALFSAESSAALLASKGVDKKAFEDTLEKDTKFKTGKKSIIEEYGIDLTDSARNGKLDPVVGREKEIERTIHILLRRSKNNPILIGEAGVGKTAIVEALAQLIVKKEVPKELQDKKIIQLDLTSLIAGASRRGEFEERLKNVIKEVMLSEGRLLLFIDEIHTLIGTGNTEGAMDASNIIKPYLARGQLQIIGTTTTAEYRKYFEKDKAFQRRFQAILVDEPSVETAIEMMKVLQAKYEKFHNVVITPEAIEYAVKLSKKYIGERYLPDKSIDLIDEAAAEVKLLAAEGKRKDTQLVRGDIEKVVSSWTGIPITKLTEDESKKLLDLENLIHQRLIDQEEAVKAVSEAVRRGRIGLASANRPIASFIFLGPTGVGKTEFAKTLAEILFGRDDAMVRLDMSEYMEKHEVAKLIGAPPGYVGYEEGGQLTEAVRQKPYSIVLLDEVEKAHPDVFNILLQLLEDGRLTDNKGNTISFKNTIVIATSNIGSRLIQETLSVQKEVKDLTTNLDKKQEAPNNQSQPAVAQPDTLSAGQNKQISNEKPTQTPEDKVDEKVFKELSKQLMDELIKFFRPELVNRFDGVAVFKPLTEKYMKAISKLGIKNTQKLLKEQNFGLEITDKALDVLAKDGFDPVYGARPLRRLIQTVIENPISIDIISKKFVQGDIIIVDYDEVTKKFTFKKSPNSLNQQANTQNGQQQAVQQNPLNQNNPQLGQQIINQNPQQQYMPQNPNEPYQQVNPMQPFQQPPQQNTGLIVDPAAPITQDPVPAPPPVDPSTGEAMAMSVNGNNQNQ